MVDRGTWIENRVPKEHDEYSSTMDFSVLLNYVTR